MGFSGKQINYQDQSFRMPGKMKHIVLWGAAIFLISMIVWANYAVLDEVTSIQGKVIPSSKTQIVQNLEGGIVKQILVKEGQVVKKNQVLVRMDDVKFSSRYHASELKAAALRIKVIRLTAELHKQKFVVPHKLTRQFPDLVKSERELYYSKTREFKALQEQRYLISEELNMTKPLLKTGAVSQVELLRLRQQINGVNKEISRFRSLSLRELNATKAEVSLLTEGNLALKDQLQRTDVRAPVNGIVEQVHISTIGGVIKPGMPLLEIVPLNDTLLIEAKVKPQDIGFLHVNQKATVKISAYDYSIYGSIPGTVEHISADTTTDAKDNSFYEVWVRTAHNYLESHGKKLRIIPGMHASVDVLTGHKTVLNYVFKPILKAKYNALRER